MTINKKSKNKLINKLKKKQQLFHGPKSNRTSNGEQQSEPQLQETVINNNMSETVTVAAIPESALIFLYESGWHLKGLIGVTEPRRVSAVTLSERVALERGELVGNTVGLTVRLIERSSSTTKIKFMTEGILMRQLLADPLLTQYSVIIVDEAHERNSLTDVLLGFLKKIVKRRSSLKLIISSATIDAGFFKEYFNFETTNSSSSIVLSVEGRMHPVEIFYLNEPCANYVHKIVQDIWKIHEKEPPGDILAFLTGHDEVLEALDLLKEFIRAERVDNIQVFPMYGSLSANDQLKVFFNLRKGVRKVVIATNIAETAITIPGVVYVIDCGFVKLKWFNTESLSDSLVIVPISKATAIQRAGRAGRICSGKVFRLYTKEDFEKLSERVFPELQRAELTTAVLHWKALGIANILRFDLPSAPPAKNLLTALETLFALEAIDEKGNLTKPIGYFLAEMPFSVMLSKMLYMSGKMGCSEEILTIIAMLQVPAVFSKSASLQSQEKIQIAKRNFAAAEGDLITLLNVYTAFMENKQSKVFCGRYNIIYHNMKRAVELRTELTKLATKYGVSQFSCKGNIEKVCKCITAGFFLNVAFLQHSGVFQQIRSKTNLFIHPLSTLYTLPQPQYIVYCEVIQTTKLYINNLTVIKEEWLTELAAHYYCNGTVRE